MEPIIWTKAWCADKTHARNINGDYIRSADGKYVMQEFGQEMFHLSRWNKLSGSSEDTGWLTREEFLSKVQVRPEQAKGKAWNKWIDEIQVGDFVKCKGQRSANVWKKILVINSDTFVAMQYTKPIDETQYVHGYSSESLIINIKEKYNAS